MQILLQCYLFLYTFKTCKPSWKIKNYSLEGNTEIVFLWLSDLHKEYNTVCPRSLACVIIKMSMTFWTHIILQILRIVTIFCSNASWSKIQFYFRGTLKFLQSRKLFQDINTCLIVNPLCEMCEILRTLGQNN